MTLEKYWTDVVQFYSYQAIVQDISVHDPGYKLSRTVDEYFTKDSTVFMLGQPHYGSMGSVLEVDPQHHGRVRVSMTVLTEPQLTIAKEVFSKTTERYMTGAQCASRTSISPHLFARITGTVFLAPPLEMNPFQERESAKNKLNVGLNLKNNKKNEEVIT